MKEAEIWVCDICGKEQISVQFPKEWYHVSVLSGYQFYCIGNNTDIEKDCCSKKCIKAAMEPLVNPHKV